MKWLLALCAFALLLTLTTPVARAGDLTPPAPVTPATTFYNINVGAGGQTDPHISGTLVSYTDNSVFGIAYYDLATGQSGAISRSDGLYDSLSDVSEGKIVFTRVASAGYDGIYAFDVNTPGAGPSPVPSPTDSVSRRRPRIGHGTIAWEQALAPLFQLEIGLYDPVLGRAVQLTNDDQHDEFLAVSPDGSTVVWTKCASSTVCDIYQATRGNGSWTPVQLTGNAGQPVGVEQLPDTNGQIVVYQCERNGEADICWQPVGGGSETRLLMPGVQRQPHISGDVISFESAASAIAQFDLYAYDLSTEILYKLTDTAISETLSDLSIGADGKVYVTWGHPKQVSPYDMDVYALSFTRLPRSSFNVHALFDQAHSYKLGGVVPIRLQLWDAQGTNISAPTLILNATGVVQKDSSSAPLGVESPGNANPDNNFRYDATLPGYIYNLSTKSLAVGTWELQFNVSGSSAPYAITFDLR